MRSSQLFLISETPDEVIFQLESGVRFRVSPIDKRFVIGQSWVHDRYIQCGTRGKNFNKRLHIFIAEFSNLSTENDIDHRDRDKLNCRRDNLRPATRSQNLINAVCENKTGHKGVTKRKVDHRYEARGFLKGRSVYLGLFDTAEEAGEVVFKWDTDNFGEFATRGN